MRVSLKWLADYVDVTLSPAELARRLTMAGIEVGSIISSGGDWDLISIARVLGVEPHPNADRLRLATVDLSEGERMTVVCGAPNVAVGQKVAFARAGARLIDGHTGKLAVLKPARIRGVESAGMVCSEKELGLSDQHEGILVLPDDAPLGAPLAAYLGDTIFDLDVTPNRPDCLSMLGVAREVAALTGGRVREPRHTYPESDALAGQRVAVEIADPDLCYRYLAAVIEGVKVEPSPAWMQERLTAGGMRPINNIVDITNYVMLEMGQPLHAFDYDRIAGAKIVVRRARTGERLRTLDGIDRPLSPEMLVIADGQQPVALAGVMGGGDSEVHEGTTTVLLESANFNAASIRRTASGLRLQSEASTRFDKGLPPELAPLAARRAIKLMVELAGGRALRGLVDAYPAPAQEVRIVLSRERLRRVLGIDPPPSRVRQVLSSLGFSCRWQPPERYEVRVPYWRTDVRIPDDVVEEVARITGYDEIPAAPVRGAIPPSSALGGQPLRDLRERVRDLLAGAGMQEVMTYPLTTLETLEKVLESQALRALCPLRVSNPVSSEFEYLRPTLRASLLRTLAANQRLREGPIALFEVARVYLPQDDGLPREPECACGVVTGRRLDRWGHATQEPLDFFDAKGYLERLSCGLGLAAHYADGEEYGLVPGRTAHIRVEERQVGVLGQVNPRLAANLGLEGEVYLFDLALDELLAAVTEEGPAVARPYQPVPRFPPVVQDMALVVEEGVPAARVQEIIEGAALVRRARLFDVYAGPPLPAGKKSLAFSITYQSPDHTLTDGEVARARRGILERLTREVGAELRGQKVE